MISIRKVQISPDSSVSLGPRARRPRPSRIMHGLPPHRYCVEFNAVTTEPITLKRIAEVTGGKLTGDGNIVATDVSHDSRRAGPGSVFVAVRGGLLDAHKFVPQVITQGAVGVISELEPDSDVLHGTEPGRVAWIQVENVRRAMALAAAEVHHHPSRELKLVGITGTNGKTTTAYLIASIPEAAGEPVAMTGTVEYRLGPERFKADRTTPEATDMQRLLRQAVEIGCKTAVMEASSQAMDFHRCDALEFAVAVFPISRATTSTITRQWRTTGLLSNGFLMAGSAPGRVLQSLISTTPTELSSPGDSGTKVCTSSVTQLRQTRMSQHATRSFR